MKYSEDAINKLEIYIRSKLCSNHNEFPYTEDIIISLSNLRKPFGSNIKQTNLKFSHIEIQLAIKSLFGIEITDEDIGFTNFVFADQMLLDYSLINSSIYFKRNQKKKTKAVRTAFLRNFSIFNKLEHIKKQISDLNKDPIRYANRLRDLHLIMDNEIELLTLEQQRIISSTNNDIHSYRNICSFNITQENINQIKGYNLLIELGWFHPKINPGGVVKDHRLSIYEGFHNMIDPAIVGHIKNCEFLTVLNNASKGSNSSILLEELQLEIKENAS